MRAVVPERRLLTADIRHGGQVALGVVTIRDGVSRRTADLRYPLQTIPLEDDRLAVRVRHPVVRYRDDLAVRPRDALQPREVVEDVDGPIRRGQTVTLGIVRFQVVVADPALALLVQQVRRLTQRRQPRLAAARVPVGRADPADRLHGLRGQELQRKLLRPAVAPVDDHLVRLLLHQPVALQPPAAGLDHLPVLPGRAVLRQRSLGQLHLPAVTEPTDGVLRPTVVGPDDRQGEPVDGEVHVDKAHGEAARLQLSFHGDRYLLRGGSASGLHRKPQDVVAVDQQSGVEHAQDAAVHGLRALRKHGVGGRGVFRVVVVSLLHRRVGQPVPRQAFGHGGADDLRGLRDDGHVGRCGDGGRARRGCRRPEKAAFAPECGGVGTLRSRRKSPDSTCKSGDRQQLKDQGKHQQQGREPSGAIAHEGPPSL